MFESFKLWGGVYIIHFAAKMLGTPQVPTSFSLKMLLQGFLSPQVPVCDTKVRVASRSGSSIKFMRSNMASAIPSWIVSSNIDGSRVNYGQSMDVIFFETQLSKSIIPQFHCFKAQPTLLHCSYPSLTARLRARDRNCRHPGRLSIFCFP